MQRTQWAYTMELTATFQDGKLLLDQQTDWPNGTKLRVIVSEEPPATTPPSLGNLLVVAGSITDMPADFAAQHDHYLHGAPKR